MGERGRNGRYRLPPLPGEAVVKSGAGHIPGGAQSMTNLASSISDTRALGIWQLEQCLIGLGMHPEAVQALRNAVYGAQAQGVDMQALKDSDAGLQLRALLAEIAEQAWDVGGANAARDAGIVRHDVWEAYGKSHGVDLTGTDEINAEIRCVRELLDAAGFEIIPELCERTVRNLAVQAAGRFDNILMQRKSGRLLIADLKGLALDTPLATPSGWTTMGAVQPGDQVYDKDGRPATVTAKSATKRIGTYVVTFDDGSKIVCDSEHIWYTGITGGQSYRQDAQPRSIQEIIETQRNPKNGQNQHVVPVAGVLHAPHASLSIQPYLLGVWLGDGHHMQGTISKEQDLLDTMRTLGYGIGKVTVDKRSSNVLYWTVLGLRTALGAAGLLGNKHIPDAYLRASAAQRTDLLRGLMDTDGTWNKKRRTAVFNSTDKALALQVVELVASLGQRPHIAEYEAKGYGKVVTAYAVEFTPIHGLRPFYLYRKAIQATTSTKKTKVAERRMIVSIEPGPDVETACISVDAPSATYLAGERMIPTHNTKRKPFWSMLEIDAQLAGYANSEWMIVNQLGDYEWYEPGPRTLGVDLTVGVVLHMPSDGSEPRLRKADLVQGWETMQLARRVCTQRSAGKSAARMMNSYWEVS